MRDYAVVANIKAKQKGIIDDVFDKGYEQGYHDGKAELTTMSTGYIADIKKAEYDRGFDEGYARAKLITTNDAYEAGYDKGYEKGLKHGQELRAKEAECAEACGMKRAWECIKKIKELSEDDRDTLFNAVWLNDIMNKFSPKEVIEILDAWEEKEDYVRDATLAERNSVNAYIKSISEETGVTFNEKEEQTTTLCRKCIHAHNMHDNILTCDAVPCVIVDGHCDKYEEKQDAPETNVENRDKIVKAIAGLWAAYGEQLWDVVADMQKNP